MIKIGGKNPKIGQHTGFGEKLLKEAEKLAIKKGKDEIAIISGIGTRNYYRKFGYDYKNGKKELDEEHHYRLEKVVKAEKYEYNKVDHKNDIG